MEDDLYYFQMEDNLSFFQREDDINVFQMKGHPNIFQIEDNLNLIQIKDHLHILANVRQPLKKIMQPKTIKIKTRVVARLRVTYFFSSSMPPTSPSPSLQFLFIQSFAIGSE